MLHRLALAGVLACGLSAPLMGASSATPDDLASAAAWSAPLTGEDAPKTVPFSFQYGGKKSGDLLGQWKHAGKTAKVDAHRTSHVHAWTDPDTGLEVRWDLITYDDYPVEEWTLHFRNAGRAESPALTDVKALETTFDRATDGDFDLHAFDGSFDNAIDYSPHLLHLGPGGKENLYSHGYSTEKTLPYFNLDWGGEGAIIAIGWSGSWSADFTRPSARGTLLRAGMTTLATTLHAGEEIRSPLIALLHWKGGDWIRAQNIWRRWMRDDNIYRVNGELPRPFTATCVDGGFPGMRSDAKGEIESLHRYVEHHSPLDYWWIDAGWYPCKEEWGQVGTWEPDPVRYPHGLKEVSDAVHADHMKLVVWFEPERVAPETWLYENHKKDWMVGGLLNLGNPTAWHWLIEHIDQIITTQGIDLYRQDYNINPADSWAKGDKPGRIGMTEMRYVEGLYAYWDELHRRHPNMLIDSCASGGRRNDLEILRRALPLLRSDYRFEPNGTQGHNYGISFWMPFNGTGVEPDSPYVMRSHFCPCFAYGGPCNDPHFNFDGRNKVAAEWRKISDDLLEGDYYPLTGYSLKPDVWMAWQFDRPEKGTGVVQAFRRADSREAAARLKLRGLDPAAPYEVRDDERQIVRKLSGKALMDGGLEVNLSEPLSSAVVTYRKAD